VTPIPHDDLGGNGRHDIDLKLVPDASASDPQRRAWLEAVFALPDQLRIGEPVRYGGSSITPLSIPILGPDGTEAALVRFEEEREISKAANLRAVLARDANLRGTTINSGKTAGDVYYVLCSLAKVVGRPDPRAEAREWIQEYRRVAIPIEGFELTRRGAFAALDALRNFPYSKRAINLHLRAVERQQADPNDAPRPPLLIDAKTGREWTSASHLGAFIRHDLERPESINDRAISGRVVENGGERRPMSVWDRSDRKRRECIGMVLIGLPEEAEAPAEDEGV
jgi:hypothetical protein